VYRQPIGEIKTTTELREQPQPGRSADRPVQAKAGRIIRTVMMRTAPPPTVSDDPRLSALRAWLATLAGQHALDLASLRPASDDASFRRYFRLDTDRGSLIAMDAPPPHEDCRPFVRVAQLLAAAGLKVPAIVASDFGQGFLLIGDLGSETLLARLDRLRQSGALTGAPIGEADRLYRGATRALTRMQQASKPGLLPDYDRALLERELMLYPDWYLSRHLGMALSDADRNTLSQAFDALLANALGQPRVIVHRDYHSRNLMMAQPKPDGSPPDDPDLPGVLDFQDAVYGPITYDLVSLLRDAYVEWPEAQQLDWAIRWWESARAAGLPVQADFGEFWRDFEWMGLQRQLKVLGIFARLHHRDGKSRYLADMPRVLAAATGVANRYREFAGLARLIDRAEQRKSTTGYTF